MPKVNWVINRRCVEPYGGGVGMEHQKKFMDIPYCIQYGRDHSVLYTGSCGNSHKDLSLKLDQELHICMSLIRSGNIGKNFVMRCQQRTNLKQAENCSEVES